MATKGAVRCKSDPTHEHFDTHRGKCKCGSQLQQACPKCGKHKSYAHFKAHEVKCESTLPLPPPLPLLLLPRPVIRFAYWASNWELNTVRNKAAFRVPPRGQLWEGLPVGVPQQKHKFRVHTVKEASVRGMQWMDTYDAIFASIAADTESFELVRVYHSWAEVLIALEHPSEAFTGLDVLVLGDWVHQVTTTNDDALPLDWLERLRMVELQTGCRMFPPLDYCFTFARKELVQRLIERCALPPACKPIPTMTVLNGKWGEALDKFVQGHPKVVLKRSISEACKHVRVMKTSRASTFAFGALPWLVQPVMAEFEQHNELRLYIVKGRFLWGVSSSFREGNEEMLSLFPFAPGRMGSDWNLEAIQVAESLVAALAQHQVHAARFLRIDMVRCNSDGGGSWYINELEFFGNTHLHLDVADDAHKIFPVLVEHVKEWMRV